MWLCSSALKHYFLKVLSRAHNSYNQHAAWFDTSSSVLPERQNSDKLTALLLAFCFAPATLLNDHLGCFQYVRMIQCFYFPLVFQCAYLLLPYHIGFESLNLFWISFYQRIGFLIVLVHLCCYYENTINWVAYRQQIRISHSSGSPESKIMAGWVQGG